MPQAKTLFLERISSLSRSIQIDAVTNRSLADRSHNDVARMLRNGLAVVGFAALEDFLKTRTSEVLSEVGKTNVPFIDLPEKLRNATTVEVVSALSFQLSHMDKAARIAYIQDHAQKISSTAASVYELTPHAFGYSQSNVSVDTVKGILKSFLIDDPWGEMSKIGAHLGLVAMPLEETFKNAALRRHRAAHVAQADTPQSDINQFIREAYAVSISFDFLLNKALIKLQEQDDKYLKSKIKISSASLKVRTVRFIKGLWKESVDGRSKSIKNSRDLNALVKLARGRATSAGNLLLLYDQDGKISSWECY
jgi:hypothetical protein